MVGGCAERARNCRLRWRHEVIFVHFDNAYDIGYWRQHANSGPHTRSYPKLIALADLLAIGQWVRANSVAPDAAILYGSSQINPYYSNLAAIGLTHDAASYPTVQRWMQWYINHLNWPDKWGLYGTSYNYDLTTTASPPRS